MSASRKKQLRREEKAAALTERQQAERKEASKLRLYTVLFTAVIIVMIAVVIFTLVGKSGIIERNTTAATVGDTKISAVEMNYYYIDSVNQYLNTYGDYASLFGLDTTLPLDEQYADEANGQTWSDYFVESAMTNMQQTYALYDAAQAEGYTMPQEAQDTIDSTIETLELYATMYGFSSADGYIKAMYGAGANEASLRDYMEVQYTAQYFYNDTMEGMTFTDEELRAAEAENFDAYSSFSYDYIHIPVSAFYEGGTTDEEGNTTYSDEEKAAAQESAKTVAEGIAENAQAEPAILETLISQLAGNNEDLSTASLINVEDRLYSSVDAKIGEWLTSGDHAEGEITCIENSSTSTDAEGNETTTVSGYYIVRYVGKDANEMNLINVRHALIGFEGGTTDESTGTTTYSEEEKATAKATADDLLAAFQAGEATEEAFAEMANTNSTDTGSNTNGGLYENVYPGQMVTAFNDWCFDETRQPGDTGIVETEYGYHIMYFVGQSETTYRDYMISSTLQSEELAAWETELFDAVTVETVNLKYINTGLTLSTGEDA